MKSRLLILFISLFSSQLVVAQQNIVKNGYIPKEKIFELVYVPFEVPEGTTAITVKEKYDKMPVNVLNMGVYGPQGHEIGNVSGFRGWSGGAKKEFFINEQDASTGYVPGKIDPGTWNVLIYPSAIDPEGLNWTLEISLTAGTHQKTFEIRPAAVQVNAIPGWYRGDLHIHTLHSDGRRTTDELVAEAKVKKLDYIISTEHNTNSANLSWGKYDSKELLIINGEEVTTTKYGHWNAIGLNSGTVIDWRYKPEDSVIRDYIRLVHQDKGLAIINHPFYDKGDKTFKFDINEFDGIEVWNGQWNILNGMALKWWDDLLRQGIMKIAIGDSDTHKSSGSPNNLGRPQTVVYATALSKTAILEGIRKGKVYLAATDSVRLEFKAVAGHQTAGIGEQLPEGKDVSVSLKVKGCANTIMTLIGDKGLISSTPVSADETTISLEVKGGSARYIRAEIRKADQSMVALTNPIWLSPFKTKK